MLIHRSGNFEMNVHVVARAMNQPTLFIHGNLASNRWWQPAFEIWKAKGRSENRLHNAYLVEWRGCGQSSRQHTEQDFDMNEIANQYLELLADLELGGVDVVGHSTGGLIALLAMLKSPPSFRRAVLLDSVAPKGFQLNDQMLEAFKAMRQERSQCAAVMAATIHNVDAKSSHFQGIVEDAFRVDPNLWTGVPKALQNIQRMNDLDQLKHPVLVLHGELDPILPKSDSEELAKALGNATYQEVVGHGHSLNVEDPTKFVGLVDKFLNS